jgi:hydrogenase nickel incorporation protein HypB
MCTTCGCSGTGEASIIEPGHSHDHGHDHSHHHHDHDHHDDDHGVVVTLEQQILAKNNLLAERNRGWFAGRGTWP